MNDIKIISLLISGFSKVYVDEDKCYHLFRFKYEHGEKLYGRQ